MDNFVKRESKMEEAQYCQPCGHSPASRTLHCGGLLPSCTSTQLGRQETALPVQCVGSCVELKQAPHQGALLVTTFAPPLKRLLDCVLQSMGNASAHDAENATGAHSSAERRPNPPIRIGSVESFRATSSLSVGISPNNALAVSHIPSLWAWQQARD